MNREYIKYYDKFLELNGKEKEIMICIEEMSELTKELCKFKRYKNTDKESVVIKNIQEEIADVLNTVEQMQHIFGEEEIEKIRKLKLKKFFENL